MNKSLLIVLLLLISTSTANACIWDRDTLAMERAKFPEVNELIVGYFPRHSSAYYEWRKEQVLAIPVAHRTPADYDDLGASYDKLGEHEEAIATMLDKLERFPDEHLYETHANLGTFYIHNGELEKGVEYIGSAIEINPDAHFGREVYQKLLVEYVIERRSKGNTLPLEEGMSDPYEATSPSTGFAAFVLNAQGLAEASGADRDKELNKAIKGVLGMMRFGNYDSPVLLEALGDLLHTQFRQDQGMQRLSARAYLKASYVVDDPAAETAYRKKAERALDMQYGVDLSNIEFKLKEEVAEGDAYFAKIESDEKAWVAAGKDVDAEFQRVYYEQVALETSKADSKPIKSPEHNIVLFVMILLGLIITVLAVVLFVVIKYLTRRKASSAEPVATPAR